MTTGYTIPGYFVNREIKNNEVKEKGLFGRTVGRIPAYWVSC